MNYIQYITLNRKIKTSLVSEQDGIYMVSGIEEPFFITALYLNDVRQVGVSFENKEALEMRSFINDLSAYDVEFIEDMFYFNSEDIVQLKINDDMSYTPAYKVYSALISQNGTAAPTVIVLENTIGNIVWTRGVIGDYFGTLVGAFDYIKTYTTIATNGFSSGGRREILVNNIDKVEIGTYTDYDGQTRGDSFLDLCPIEIRVYI